VHNSSYHYCRNEGEIAALSRQVIELGGTLTELRQENRELRKAIMRLTERLLSADILGESDQRWLAELFGQHAQGGDSLKQAAARAAHQVVGKVRCRCGALIDDIEGITDERCPWCGEQVATER
jgi:hypothetical protein